MKTVRSFLLAGLLATASLSVPAGSGQARPAPPAALSAAHDPLAFGPDAVRPGVLVSGRHGMVVSAQHLASAVGAEILREGGNAADAAVAVGYALAVVYPAAGNIGGGGFMVLHPKNGQSVFVDFREHAPGLARADLFQDSSGHVIAGLSAQGWKAVAVPGTVAGLETVLKRWGRLTRAQVMAPAIALARDGFILGEGDVELLHTSTEYFRNDPHARRIFLRPDGTALQVGDRLVQKSLARSLERIARQGGEKAFYRGPIAEEILKPSRKGGGILRREDFSAYRVRIMEPLRCVYRGYVVHTAPPPSGGGVALCEMLNILSGYDLQTLGLHSAPAVQHEIEAMRHAYSDRRDLGDPAFVRNPVAHLLDPAYAAAIRAALPEDGALSSSALRPGVAAPAPGGNPPPSPAEKRETTHFSVLDGNGMAVSATYTLNGWFGAGVMGGESGIWMNDEMDDFSAKPGAPNMFGITGSAANGIAPGKTPLSSMAPTIVTKDGRVVMVLGSPGGSRIPTILLSTLLGVIDYGLDIRQAVDLPRIHEQWTPSEVEIEPGALTDGVRRTLEAQGYRFTLHRPWGIAQAILAGEPRLSGPRTGEVYGASDPRHPDGGAAAE